MEGLSEVNFDLSEEQQVVKELSQRLFTDMATPERLKEVERGVGFDEDLWAALAEVGLVGLCLPEAAGGSGMGMVELCLIAQQQGRWVAPVPLIPTVLAAQLVASHLPAERELVNEAVSVRSVLSVAFAEWGLNDALFPSVVATIGDGWVHLKGRKPAVPALPVASHVLVSAKVDEPDDTRSLIALIEVDGDGVEIDPLETTNHEAQGHLSLDTRVPASSVFEGGQILRGALDRYLLATSAMQLGVAEGAVAAAAQHVANRHQFGRPFAAFQAVSQRAADCYIITEAIRSTVLNAAWQCDNADDPAADILAAAYWACEGTQQVVLNVQHLHGGIGADVDYPVHRYFLWGMQLATTLGSPSAHLQRLGALIAGSKR